MTDPGSRLLREALAERRKIEKLREAARAKRDDEALQARLGPSDHGEILQRLEEEHSDVLHDPNGRAIAAAEVDRFLEEGCVDRYIIYDSACKVARRQLGDAIPRDAEQRARSEIVAEMRRERGQE